MPLACCVTFITSHDFALFNDFRYDVQIVKNSLLLLVLVVISRRHQRKGNGATLFSINISRYFIIHTCFFRLTAIFFVRLSSVKNVLRKTKELQQCFISSLRGSLLYVFTGSYSI
ncbi:hypothetical protein DICVIV_10882 [Dictyocaulus viviparus]|uniref:Uncharacterized protein n=1 Tax=Dictyocaulus viviparus TaxID=29172 RepID=A0A0D8XL98_DICVI|nr:hypothetical protein DICVIV_10882 [Dictyocaulus viviparus]